ncbi:hypothetical protein TcCL_NonESM08908 [Trypanosoma cruzi]|uniref:Uncharacterized protein n=1 Tax=Trypanosoma cruzi (strain CL Brener) TaxID=353153 RepID=Q4DKH1_TRYCC|nr:hypothetical protein Tc00.1047053511385.60 [Trypanosoma cruzi]EAN93020.1 hypothetical protein Tc00.1047053511385.60 [Trypanosoma cruzi]RNC41514.1 hypothetical protein TcCL_NonESM08908 [Trypanosoma cruzi]|eukprot:XP_814871.1 hypothetical protein [Trypanosoma cruzi strain CL Brener]
MGQRSRERHFDPNPLAVGAARVARQSGTCADGMPATEVCARAARPMRRGMGRGEQREEEAQRDQQSTQDGGRAKQFAYLPVRWKMDAEKIKWNVLRRIPVHVSQSTPCRGTVSYSRHRLADAVTAAANFINLSIAAPLEGEGPYRLPGERFAFEKDSYKSLGSSSRKTLSFVRRANNEVTVCQLPKSISKMRGSVSNTPGVPVNVEAVPNSPSVHNTLPVLEAEECTLTTLKATPPLPQLLSSEECAPHVIEAAESEQPAAEEVADARVAVESTRAAIVSNDAVPPAALVDSVVFPKSAYGVVDPVYAVVERSLLKERHYLEKLQEIIKEVLLAERESSPAAEESAVAILPEEKKEVKAPGPLKPVWYARPKQPQVPSSQRVKGGRPMRYTALGDAVVRSAWSGSL